MAHIKTEHITILRDDDSNEAVVFFDGDGTNGTRKFHFTEPDGMDLDLTGFALRFRLLDADKSTVLIATQTMAITDATAGLAEVDLSAENLASSTIQDNAIAIFFNVVSAKNEIIRQKRVDIVPNMAS